MDKASNRVSYDQRLKLLEFMRSHEDFARGRLIGPEGSRTKKIYLKQMSQILNAVATGATKTPEKWLKCWQDWKSDVKAKALKIKKTMSRTGGGPGPAPLSDLEQQLLDFIGFEAVEGLNVPDSLELSQMEENNIFSDETMETQLIETDHRDENANFDNSRTSTKKCNDPLLPILTRQASAIEDMAKAMHDIAIAIKEVADALKGQARLVLTENDNC